MKRANLRRGALPDVKAEDRWLIKLRGHPTALACRVERFKGRGVWVVTLEESLRRVDVEHLCFLALLPPAPRDYSKGALAVELMRVRTELRRLADEVAFIREERTE